MEKEIKFKSHFSIFFYISLLFIVGVLGFTLNNIIEGTLDIPNFLLINLLSFFIAYYNFLQFNCQITLTKEALKIRYILSLKRSITINVQEITEFDKHKDTAHRIYKNLFIKTLTDSHIIRYSISDDSDEELILLLKKVAVNAL